MSTTYTVGREVFALRTDRGTALYLLTEKTYESNVSPQIPHWSVVYFGEAAGAVAKIFSHASACEGGMLTTRSRRSTPESYIASWLPHLAKPRVCPISAVNLIVTNSNGWLHSGQITRERSEAIIAILNEQGLRKEATDLRDRATCTLSLSAHGETIVGVLCRAEMSPWRLFEAPDTSSGAADASLGIGKTPANLPIMPFKKAYRIPDNETVLLQDENGIFRAKDWPYGLIGAYVVTLGTNVSAVPANYATLIRAYRSHIESAPVLDAATLRVRIDTTVPLESKYDAERLAEAAALEGAVNIDSIITVPYSRECAYKLTAMPTKATSWVFPSEPTTLFELRAS